jgi:hypothetical protein
LTKALAALSRTWPDGGWEAAGLSLAVLPLPSQAMAGERRHRGGGGHNGPPPAPMHDGYTHGTHGAVTRWGVACHWLANFLLTDS